MLMPNMGASQIWLELMRRMLHLVVVPLVSLHSPALGAVCHATGQRNLAGTV
jgi:hypothetical protein